MTTPSPPPTDRKRPTRADLIKALADLAAGAELAGEKLNIIQPFFGIYKRHGAVIEAAKREAGKP